MNRNETAPDRAEISADFLDRFPYTETGVLECVRGAVLQFPLSPMASSPSRTSLMVGRAACCSTLPSRMKTSVGQSLT
jgi:hypothetical protein